MKRMVSIATLPRKARGHKQVKNGSAQTKTGQPIDFDVLCRNEMKTFFGLHEFLPDTSLCAYVSQSAHKTWASWPSLAAPGVTLCGKAGSGRRKKEEGEEKAYTL